MHTPGVWIPLPGITMANDYADNHGLELDSNLTLWSLPIMMEFLILDLVRRIQIVACRIISHSFHILLNRTWMIVLLSKFDCIQMLQQLNLGIRAVSCCVSGSRLLWSKLTPVHCGACIWKSQWIWSLITWEVLYQVVCTKGESRTYVCAPQKFNCSLSWYVN